VQPDLHSFVEVNVMMEFDCFNGLRFPDWFRESKSECFLRLLFCYIKQINCNAIHLLPWAVVL
jgi:hypothetical protein